MTLLSSTTESEHIQLVDQVLEYLEKAGLRGRKENAIFMSSVTYLGDKINVESLHPLLYEVKALQDALTPANV